MSASRRGALRNRNLHVSFGVMASLIVIRDGTNPSHHAVAVEFLEHVVIGAAAVSFVDEAPLEMLTPLRDGSENCDVRRSNGHHCPTVRGSGWGSDIAVELGHAEIHHVVG